MQEIRNAWGFTLFADDLRYEVGGKFSLIGIYQIDMIQPMDFPVIIPKLSLLVKYYEVKGALKGDLNVKIFLPGDLESAPTLSWTIPEAARDNAPTVYEPDPESYNLYSLSMPVIISPLNVREEGFVKVRIQCGDITTRLGRLMIRKTRDTDKVAFISPIASPPPSSQSPPVAPPS